MKNLNKNKALLKYISEIKEIAIIHLPNEEFDYIRIENKSDKYCTLRYATTEGFYISTSGFWASPEQAAEFAKKLNELAIIAKILNLLINN